MDPFLQSGYKYAQLSNKDIRLIDLKPSKIYTAPLECSIFCFPLARPPAYVALSYFWGTAEQSSVIFLDGEPVPVTQNLQDALRRLRSEGCSLLWVDAVCIDQRNHAERSFQVARMAAIYRKARAVAVWLGPEVGGSNSVMTAIETSNPIVPDEEITTFLAREYWRRIWIIQEVAYGARVTIFCGGYRVEWDKFQMVFRQWTEKIDVLSNQALAAIVNLCHLRETVDTRPDSLLKALCRSRNSRSGNHRDKVYGILGLAFDSSAFVPEPNYDLPEAVVCENMSEDAILAKRTLDYIFLASSQTRSCGPACSNMTELASWCTDYLHLDHRPLDERMVNYLDGNDERFRLGVMCTKWSATAGTVAGRHNVMFRNRVLRARAWYVSDVDGLSSTFQPGQDGIFQSRSNRGRYWDTQSAIVRVLAMCFRSYNSAGQSIQLCGPWGGSWFGFLGRPVINKMYKDNRQILDWMSANDKFLIDGKSLRDWRRFSFRGYGGDVARTPSQIVNFMSKIPTSIKDTTCVAKEILDDMYQPSLYKSVVDLLNEGLRLMTTWKGHVGLVHPSARPGDSIFLISGCSMPAILRKKSGTSSFTLIGHAYIDGLMDGEQWTKNASSSLKDIYIS